ncbi:MAG: hypothetical protein KJ583_00095 [Nanoarchaeota archaeon]|nr:hypothetical protein [Nanoarchaeota archaeon]MBU1270475.1 hypothetical protein [Nanoarchaeota archaeon]MBU1603688.1 hypothetical protein [Nanoarchaeota archaeon]MBU2443717.1 hypothetical protein [Nanoarchaeota archaeon]
MVRNSKGQVWSIDLVIGLLVFALVLVIFYSLLTGERDSKISSYTNKAETVTQRMYEKGLVNPLSSEINEVVYTTLSEEEYENLKQELGIKGDFCLFIETTDNPPKLLIINNRTGIGSPRLSVGGFNCGANVVGP